MKRKKYSVNKMMEEIDGKRPRSSGPLPCEGGRAVRRSSTVLYIPVCLGSLQQLERCRPEWEERQIHIQMFVEFSYNRTRLPQADHATRWKKEGHTVSKQAEEQDSLKRRVSSLFLFLKEGKNVTHVLEHSWASVTGQPCAQVQLLPGQQ